MPTFFIFLQNLMSFNIAWIIGFILNNLFWLFALGALSHFLFGKHALKGFFFLTLALWLWDDFETLAGIGFKGAQVLALYYVSKIGLLAVVENSELLKKHFLIVSTVSGAAALLLANVFA